MIYGSTRQGSDWLNYVMLERYDLSNQCDEVKEKFTTGKKYPINGNGKPFAPNMGNMFTPFNNWVKKANEAARKLMQYAIDHREEKAKAERETRKKMYTCFVSGQITFCTEDKFDIDELDLVIAPDGPKPETRVAPQAVEKMEPMEKPGVSTGADPGKPVEEARIIPSTMAGLKKILPCLGKRCSSYDFGVRTVGHAVTTPTLEATMRAYRKVALLAIARALVARSYGVEFSVEDVKRTIDNDWNRNSYMKLYAEVMLGNMGMAAIRRCIEETEKMVANFIEGKVNVSKKVMADFKDQRWSVEAFLKYTWELYRMPFKRVEEPKKVV